MRDRRQLEGGMAYGRAEDVCYVVRGSFVGLLFCLLWAQPSSFVNPSSAVHCLVGLALTVLSSPPYEGLHAAEAGHGVLKG